MSGLAITSLTLSHFRSHKAARLHFDGRPVALVGPNVAWLRKRAALSGVGGVAGAAGSVHALSITRDDARRAETTVRRMRRIMMVVCGGRT